MKKLFAALLLTVVPVLMAATADSSVMSSPYGNASSAAQDPNNPQSAQHIQFLNNQQGPRQAQDGMSLSSDEFGWSGPLSFVTTYSEEYGWMLSGQYTQKINHSNALSLLLTGGAKQQRANLTWGVAVASQQRVKLTAEYLRQDMDFDFFAGHQKEWEGQQAYGLAYQYVIPHSWLNAVNVDVNYSLAQTRNLSTVLYNSDSMRNFRRVAGGRDVGLTTGVDIVPNSQTLFDVAANYDNVKYNTKYQNNQNEAGFGATLNLQHLLTRRVKWQLLASEKVPVSTYGTELDYLLPTAAGTNLQLTVSANRDLGKGDLQNDFRVNAGVNYMWGGNPHADANQTYQLGSVDSATDLNSWASQPAVEKPQVLAVVDQKQEAVNNSANNQAHDLLNLAACPSPYEPVKNPDYTQPASLHTLPVGRDISIDLGRADESFEPSNAQTLFHNSVFGVFPGTAVTAENLPEGLHIAMNTAGHVMLTGRLNALPQLTTVRLKETVNIGGRDYVTCDAEAQTITIGQAGRSIVPVASPVVLTVGHAPTDNEAELAVVNAGSNNATVSNDTVGFTPALVDHGMTHTLVQTQAPSPTQPGVYDLKFTGTPANESTSVESYSVQATNSDGQTINSDDNTAPTPKTFTFVVKGPPIRNNDALNGGDIGSGQSVNVSFANYFTNNLPAYSGDMHYWLCPSNSYSADNCVEEGQPGTDQTHGLSVTSDAAVTGTLQASTTPGDYNLYIFAVNDHGGVGDATGVSQPTTFAFTALGPMTALRCPTAAEASQSMASDAKSFVYEGHTFSIIDAPGSRYPESKQQFENNGYFTGALMNNNVQNRYSCVYAIHGAFSGVYYNADNIRNMHQQTPANWANVPNGSSICGSVSAAAHNPQDCGVNYNQ